MSVHGTNVVVRRIDDVVVVAFARPDVIDPAYIRQTTDEIVDIIEDCDTPCLVIDFEGVRYLSSAALGTIVGLHKQVTDRGGDLCIANVAPEVECVFNLTRLTQLVEVCETVETAVRTLKH